MLNRYVSVVLLAFGLIAGCNRDPEAAKRKYIENGNKYFEKGKYKEALIMYKNALKKDLRYGEGYYRAALAELKLHQYGAASRDLQRAVELQPTNLDANSQLTNLFLTAYLTDRRKPKNLLEELRSLSEKMDKNFPGSFEDARLKGYLSVFDNKPKDAIAHFEKANSIRPNQPELVLIYMQALAADGQLQLAEQLAYETLKKDPKALAIYDALFLQYVRSNRLEDGERILKSKLENNPGQSDPYLQLAAHHYTNRRRPEMLATLQRLTSNTKDFPTAHLLVGDFFLRIREDDMAMQEYSNGVKASGKDKAQYQKRMAEVLVRREKKEEAKQLIQEILKEQPKDDEAIAMRASLSMLTGTKDELQSAINDLQAVVGRIPDNPVLRNNLGRALLAKGDIQAAKIQFEEAVKLRADYTMPRYSLAQITMQNRDFSRTLQLIQEILTYEPGSVQAHLIRTRALIGSGDFATARRELTMMAQQKPDLPELNLQLAALDLQEKKFGAAEQSFRKLYAQTQDQRAFMGLIESQVAQGQSASAMKLLRDELAKSPEKTQYRVALANISVSNKDYPAAIAEYKAALDKMPRASDVWVRLGETYQITGNTAQAIESFKKAAEVAPNNVAAHLQLAVLNDTIGRADEARPLYEKALRLQPDNPIALNNLAFMLADRGTELDQALTMAQKAKQQLPQNGDISDTLGWIYIKKNLADSAIGVYRDLVQQQPERATYRYHFAMALAQKGDKTQAMKECETALRKNPKKDEEAKIRELMTKLV